MKEDSILLVGTGALATLFAARLGAAGHSVSMLGTWKQGLQALRENGARIQEADGSEQAYPVYATDDPLEVSGAKFAIVLVKSWQTERVARQLKLALADDGHALTLQNGLGNREILSRFLDKDLTTETTENTEGFENKKKTSARSVSSVVKKVSRVSLGVTTTGATLLGPGLVRTGGEGVISIEQNETLDPLKLALKSSNFNVQVVDDAQSLIWGKLVINAAINPLTALLQVPNGELLARPAVRRMMASLASETAEVAAAEHVHLPFSNPVSAAEDVARKTARNISSMFQDVRRGAPTEIDAICGAVTKRAEVHGINTPYNRACWQLVRAL
jgi:2-dehydropantoate 2-reductase